MNSEQVKEEAKQIMDSFMKALEEVGDVEEEYGNRRKENVRKPSECKYGSEFKEKMLANAPKKEDDCIVAEKKKW